MSLKDQFQAVAVRLINQAFLSVSQPVTLTQPILQQYDEESGMVFTSAQEETVNAVIGPWVDDRRQALNSDAVQTEDLKCILAFLDVTLNLNIGVDTVTTQDGTIYSIVTKSVDPAEAAITLRLAKMTEELDD